MDSGTERSAEELAYWRRRAIALTAVLATVGVVVWACSSDGGGKKRPIRNAGAVSTTTPTPARSSGGIPSAMPTITVTATTKVTVTPSVTREDGDACEPGDVVINLAASKETYTAKEWPQLGLTVVNTGERACTFDVGPKALETRITSGSDRVWSSAHCATGTGSSIQMLRRGIPYLATVGWDRKRSADGCPAKRPGAGPGTYVASVKSGDIKVKRQVFRLR